jgi:predicted metal-binding protein
MDKLRELISKSLDKLPDEDIALEKLTIEELEKILESNGGKIVIKPNGEITTITREDITNNIIKALTDNFDIVKKGTHYLLEKEKTTNRFNFVYCQLKDDFVHVNERNCGECRANRTKCLKGTLYFIEDK